MILTSWFLTWCFCSGFHSLSCAEGTPLCMSERVPGEALHLEGRFSCPAHSGLWDTLSHMCMYIVLPFPLSFSPNPRPTVLTQAVFRLIKLSIPVSHVWLAGSELRSFLWADRGELPTVVFLPSLFVSILFRLSVDFTLLAGKRRLPSTNFFKLNFFFLI